ncbi:hypothetical protein TWF694_003657 [Orbilia ellipsospora]|uniref:Uncharacterized protein n=1 Tax=Orbilia ellipsospora TaxID=2528407 RepID=A0AAV9WYV7_9PEZI
MARFYRWISTTAQHIVSNELLPTTWNARTSRAFHQVPLQLRRGRTAWSLTDLYLLSEINMVMKKKIIFDFNPHIPELLYATLSWIHITWKVRSGSITILPCKIWLSLPVNNHNEIYQAQSKSQRLMSSVYNTNWGIGCLPPNYRKRPKLPYGNEKEEKPKPIKRSRCLTGTVFLDDLKFTGPSESSSFVFFIYLALKLHRDNLLLSALEFSTTCLPSQKQSDPRVS